MTAGVERLSAPSPEIVIERRGVYLCLLVNRAQRAMRVIDFRSGPSPDKCRLILEVARRHAVERLFTLVERDEMSAWARLGFTREGCIPGFYKRSDAYVLGSLLDEADAPHQSGTRIAIPASHRTQSSGPKSADAAFRIDPRLLRATRMQADNSYQNARKLARAWGAVSAAPRITNAGEDELRRARAVAERAGAALGSFDPFSRDAERCYYSCASRGGLAVVASVESQPCFDNAYLQLVSAPRAVKEAMFTARAVSGICEALRLRGVVSCFAITPVQEAELAAIFLGNGFRRTGILHRHLVGAGERQDAFLWSRKLALPSDA